MDERIAKQNIASFWHGEKNGELELKDVNCGSHRLLWWRCEKGHEWQAAVYTVSRSGKCPYCSGRKVIPGETDLATTHPQLLAEWDSEKNTITPQEISAGSERKVWWKCPKGHSYPAMVFSKASGTNCPYCAGKKVLKGFNDLQTTDPKIAQQWNCSKNGGLTPGEVSRGSHKKVWWRCEKGHEWQAAIYTRTRERASGCPICHGRIGVRPDDANPER